MIVRAIVWLTLALAAAPFAAAEPPARGEAARIATRPGVSLPIYEVWRDDAKATVILFSGGGGGYGKLGDDGWPGSGNFLIRTGRRWAEYPFNVIMVGRPTDGIDLASGGIRTGPEHQADNLALFRHVRARSSAPLWLVGTSMGTISVAAAAIEDKDGLVAGLVLTSSIVARKLRGAVTGQNLEHIRVPTLVVHHEEDACWACRPAEAREIVPALKGAPLRKTIFVTGGGTPDGDPCGPFHRHGFVGLENETVDRIAAWILAPTE